MCFALAPLRHKAMQRPIADIVAAIPTLHVREQLAGANNWHDCCAAVCKLLKKLLAPADGAVGTWCGIHPPAAQCEPKQLATAAGWGQRHLLFEGASTSSPRRQATGHRNSRIAP